MTQAYNLSQFANRLNTSGQINPSGAFSSVIPINMGGTNNGSLLVTAGGVIYTDGTKMVNVGAGSANQVLTSQGAGAPTWQTPSGGGFSDMQIYTSGTGTWTIPAGKTSCKITVVGGGGGGGGTQGSTSYIFAGAGGGGGGASIRYYTGLTPGNTISYAVGAAGSSSSAGNNGGGGGTSSVSSGTQTITSISATGGGGGSGSNFGTNAGAGGAGSGGTANISGCAGVYTPSSNVARPGCAGGSSIFGGGGLGGSPNGANGSSGGAYGGGGGGGGAGGSGNYGGGAGAAGVVIIEY